ncbi:MAG: SLBB domain-containing protein [Verrucomicrobiota bacterium JB023]|nr:SLBB domain-containing protein [Verrucomicrobiota bacterium JB023]
MEVLLRCLSLILLAATAQAAGSHRAHIELRVLSAPPEVQKELNRIYQVDQNGFLTVEGIGRIQTSEQSLVALARQLEALLRRRESCSEAVVVLWPASPDSTDALGPKLITVIGLVSMPGQFEVDEGMTVSRALDAAGGLSSSRRKIYVYVYRDGRRYLLDYPENEKHRAERLYPGDVIEVLERKTVSEAIEEAWARQAAAKKEPGESPSAD